MVEREKIDEVIKPLVIPPTVDWSYCANRFELGSRSDPASRLEEPYSVIIGCLLIDHVMLIDSHRSMIKPLVADDANLTIIDCESLIFTLPEVFSRRTLSLSLFSSLRGERKSLWDQGTVYESSLSS